jgi:hypothetical protein
MNLKLFNEELYKNSEMNKCAKCSSVLTEGNKFNLVYEFTDELSSVDIKKTSIICRACCEQLNAYLHKKEYAQEVL